MGYDPLAFRFMCLNSHYRKQLVFSYDALKQAQTTLIKLRNKISNISNDGLVDEDYISFYNRKFIDCLSMDLNTANALSILYEMLKDNNINGATKHKLVNMFDIVFSLDLNKCESNLLSKSEEEEIAIKIEKRAIAKKNKDFELADKIRDELLEKGIKLVDTRDGTTYELI